MKIVMGAEASQFALKTTATFLAGIPGPIHEGCAWPIHEGCA